MSITVDLGRDLEAFVARVVQAGAYASEAAVIRDAVRIFQDREARRVALDEAINVGLADLEAGRVETLEEVRDHLRATFETLASTVRP